jgi:peptidoglycan/xylan/chitin deacetylase (PgdA/CDA1 family)
MPRTTIFTVDVESDWEGSTTEAVETVLPKLLDFLREHHITATFFVVGNLIERFEDELREVARRHELASHSHNHTNLMRLSKEDRMSELLSSKRALADIGVKCIGFRAPFNMIPEGCANELRSAGYVYDSSLSRSYFPGRYYNRDIPNRPYMTSSESLKEAGSDFLEIPVSSYSLFKLPFGLSFLRAFHHVYPLSRVGRISCFYLHLHEFLDKRPPAHAGLLTNILSRRNSGGRAWQILQEMITYLQPKGVSCRQYIKSVYPRLL